MFTPVRGLLITAVVSAAALSGTTVVAAPANAAPAPRVANGYIVQLAPGVTDVAALAPRLVAPLGGTVTYTYSHVLNGFAVRLPAPAAALLRVLPIVTSVRADVLAHTTGDETDATWGLDRVDQNALPLDGHYRYPDSAGAGSNIYVIDTGLDAQHSEFAGRVGASRNFVPGGLLGFGSVNPDAWTDCDGHGTHVTSTAAGTTWGVAKQATVHAVRVLNCNGTGTSSAIIAGIDWVAANHEANSVANLSLGTSSRSSDLETAVTNLVGSGVAVAVAAGNDSTDACTESPAAAPSVLTVGATSKNDARASFSNYGSCVDLFAPGEAITGAKLNSTSGSVEMSGTSMASPHVAGVLALLRAARPSLSAAQAESAVVEAATTGVVTSPGASSPNRLLYSGFVAGATSPEPSPTPSATPSATPSSTPSATPTASPTASPTAPCSGCASTTGTLATGGIAYPAGSNGFTGSGALAGYLRGPAGANFDLSLEKRSCGLLFCSWSTVASGTGATADETVRYTAASATYRWVITAVSGSGSYTFWRS